MDALLAEAGRPLAEEGLLYRAGQQVPPGQAYRLAITRKLSAMDRAEAASFDKALTGEERNAYVERGRRMSAKRSLDYRVRHGKLVRYTVAGDGSRWIARPDGVPAGAELDKGIAVVQAKTTPKKRSLDDDLHGEATKAKRSAATIPAGGNVVSIAHAKADRTARDSIALSAKERRELHALEAKVERGITVWREAAQALNEIRERKLYRATHRTFEAYCQARWNFGASRARQLILAERSVTAGNAPAGVNERQVRALARGARSKTQTIAPAKTITPSGSKPTTRDAGTPVSLKSADRARKEEAVREAIDGWAQALELLLGASAVSVTARVEFTGFEPIEMTSTR
jgi:hypothetical protein